MNKTVLLLALAFVAAPASGAEEAAPHKSVDELVTVCASCHGERGDAPIAPNYPILAGQHASYLEHALKGYRNGERKNPVMSAQAANLSDTDIRALSQYFAVQPGPLHTPAAH